MPCLAHLGGNSDMRGKEQALVSKYRLELAGCDYLQEYIVGVG